MAKQNRYDELSKSGTPPLPLDVDTAPADRRCGVGKFSRKNLVLLTNQDHVESPRREQRALGRHKIVLTTNPPI